jgi:osmoprotectant transport system ATP-binding protein
MGDLVAVFHTGGIVAQFGPPAEILASPGVGLRRPLRGHGPRPQALSLFRVGDLELARGATARPGDDAAECRRRALADPFDHLLLVDGRPASRLGQPGRRSHGGPLTADLASPESPFLDRRTTLKDALSMLLDADVQAGVVVDRAGAYRGIVTLDQITAFRRELVTADTAAGTAPT